ncbi:GNAT family N-acetyltransferase [Tsukamurella tyrosinosolvens]|uniref:GNAT family N-acetyltransferase n=1 Tax=Tsukamurella tyrosinosolvens TaxID=57704 RepID=UPI000B146CF8|nr:GNAT family N-acetyltransferase [Tsukamurella tyrosinosolvens]MCA4993785.1 GNAT family N-acetyltransferase [Tsukamurella tyrosinosolvens]
MNTRSPAIRRRIGGHAVELRAPRLSDADSWRSTSLEHELRLRPALGRPGTDWSTQHSSVAWAETWWRAHTAPSIVDSRIVIVDDASGERVAGQAEHHGPDRRTGHLETSIWLAGVHESRPIAIWVVATTMLDVFRAYPEVPRIVAPVAVRNGRAIALLESLGSRRMQTLRLLREYDEEPADHFLYAMENTEADQAVLEQNVDAVGALPLPPHRTAAVPSLGAALGAARLGVRHARALPARSTRTRPLPAVVRTTDGLSVGFEAVDADRFRARVDGAVVGAVQLTVDLGSSTTEVIDRLSHETAAVAGGAVVVAACRAASERQGTRRLTVALADRHAFAADALAALGFVSEGATMPTLGDESTPRESWTRLRR